MAADPDIARIEADADRAAASRRIGEARRLLAEVTARAPDRIEPWLKLAALCRADGHVDAALDAAAGALRIDPLGFVPLLVKASLLETAGRGEEAARHYGYAIAQQPDQVPPGLAAQLDHAQQVIDAWRARAEARMADAVPAPLDPRETRRLARFRSNIIGRARPWHSEPTHFHYPGLAEREFHDREDFPWLDRIEAATDIIRAEFEALMASERAELVPYIQYSEDQPLAQWRDLNWNPAWTALHLAANGERIEANARHCPETLALLGEIGQPEITHRSPNAMFSLLAPGTRIPPHHGVANTRLVCHLPLIVPEKCWFRCGSETREWRLGEAFVFDDTIEHEAANESGEPRVVLIFDVWHPGLSPAERDSVAATMAASEGGGDGL